MSVSESKKVTTLRLLVAGSDGCRFPAARVCWMTQGKRSRPALFRCDLGVRSTRRERIHDADRQRRPQSDWIESEEHCQVLRDTATEIVPYSVPVAERLRVSPDPSEGVIFTAGEGGCPDVMLRTPEQLATVRQGRLFTWRSASTRITGHRDGTAVRELCDRHVHRVRERCEQLVPLLRRKAVSQHSRRKRRRSGALPKRDPSAQQ